MAAGGIEGITGRKARLSECKTKLRTAISRLRNDLEIYQVATAYLDYGVLPTNDYYLVALSELQLGKLREAYAAVWFESCIALETDDLVTASQLLTPILVFAHLPYSRSSRRSLTVLHKLAIPILLGGSVFWDPGVGFTGLILYTIGWSILSLLGFSYKGVLLDKLAAECADALALLRDPSSLNAIAESLPLPLENRPFHYRFTQAQGVAVTRAIPQVASALTHEHYGTLTRRTVRTMTSQLPRASDDEALMLLHGLEMADSPEAMSAVAKLMRAHPDDKVREAAKRTYDALERRKQAEHAAAHLLRPTEAIPAEEALLRPAAMGHTEDQGLLRPSNNGQD